MAVMRLLDSPLSFRKFAPLILAIPTLLVAQTASVSSVVNSYGVRLSPGSLVTVEGTNLEGAVGVQVGGKTAAVLTPVSATKIAIQLPVDVGPGPTTLVVSSGSGSSVPFPLTLDTYAPIFRGAGIPCNIGQGTILEVLAGGLGPTDPPVATGQTANPATLARTVAKVSFTLDGTPAEVMDSALVTWYPGVYAVNEKVPPELPDGNYSGVLSVAGLQSNPMKVALFKGTHFSNSSVNGQADWGAPESLMTAQYCGGLANTTVSSDYRNPPTTLGGTNVVVKDSAGLQRLAPLLYVSPGKVNYMIPAGTVPGVATVTLTTSTGFSLTATQDIRAVAPSIFYYPYMAGSDPQPSPVAQLVRIRAGQQTIEPVTSQIDMGPATDRVYVVLFGTGLRHRSSLQNVHVTFSSLDDDVALIETEAPVEYAGAQNEFVGLDQVNVLLPRSLAGMGAQGIRLKVDGNTWGAGVLVFK
jgi:uncharacterized protein (TIGR03437 family)